MQFTFHYASIKTLKLLSWKEISDKNLHFIMLLLKLMQSTGLCDKNGDLHFIMLLLKQGGKHRQEPALNNLHFIMLLLKLDSSH